jgi:hypothetical protein
MKQRCLNSSCRSYSDYGGRGIKVCKLWINSFEEFIGYIGPRPEPKNLYSLDRIDNNGHYEPGNVRWATRAEQRINTRPRKAFSSDKYEDAHCKVCEVKFKKLIHKRHYCCSIKCRDRYAWVKRKEKMMENKSMLTYMSRALK